MTRDDHYAPAPISLPELLARYDPERLAADLAEDPTAVLDAAEWDAWVMSLPTRDEVERVAWAAGHDVPF